ncbi:MAG: LysM peptidoglycan-binding domain-containing protein [Hyphomicrobiaceae bacterium]
MQKRVLSILSAGGTRLLLAGGLLLAVGLPPAPATAQTANRGTPAAGTSGELEKLIQPVTDWLERANREYQDNVVRELSVPTGHGGDLEAAKAAQVSRGVPGLIERVKDYLGIETAKTPIADPTALTEAASRDEALKRQLEARKLEQERNAEQQRAAEQQRLAMEAKKTAEAVDAITKQNQKAAEAARLASEERRKAGEKPQATTKTAGVEPSKLDAKTLADKAAADLAAAERKAAAETEAVKRKAVAAAEKVAAEKAEADRKAVAAAEKAAADKLAAERKTLAEASKADAARKAAAAGEKAAADRKAMAALDEPKRKQEAAPQQAQAQKDQAAADAARKAAQTPKVADGDTAAPLQLPTAGKTAGQRPADQAAGSTVRGTEKATKRVKVAVRDVGSDKRSGKVGRCARAGRDVELPAMYVVKSGDTLWDISRRYYNKGMRFEKIVRANQNKIGSPDLIFPCQKFFLPGRSALYWALPMDDTGAS